MNDRSVKKTLSRQRIDISKEAPSVSPLASAGAAAVGAGPRHKEKQIRMLRREELGLGLRFDPGRRGSVRDGSI